MATSGILYGFRFYPDSFLIRLMGKKDESRYDLFDFTGLLKEVVRPQSQALQFAFTTFINGKHDDDSGWICRFGGGENVKPAPTRHLKSNNDRIRLGSLDPTNCFLNVTGFPYNFDPLNTSRK